jgi:hypothetical protein
VWKQTEDGKFFVSGTHQLSSTISTIPAIPAISEVLLLPDLVIASMATLYRVDILSLDGHGTLTLKESITKTLASKGVIVQLPGSSQWLAKLQNGEAIFFSSSQQRQTIENMNHPLALHCPGVVARLVLEANGFVIKLRHKDFPFERDLKIPDKKIDKSSRISYSQSFGSGFRLSIIGTHSTEGLFLETFVSDGLPTILSAAQLSMYLDKDRVWFCLLDSSPTRHTSLHLRLSRKFSSWQMKGHTYLLVLHCLASFVLSSEAVLVPALIFHLQHGNDLEIKSIASLNVVRSIPGSLV